MASARRKVALGAVCLAACCARSLFAFAAATPCVFRPAVVDGIAVDHDLQLCFVTAGPAAGNVSSACDVAISCTQQLYIAGSHPPFHLASVAVDPEFDCSDPRTHTVLSHVGYWTAPPGTVHWEVDVPVNTSFVLRLTDGQGDVRFTCPSTVVAGSEKIRMRRQAASQRRAQLCRADTPVRTGENAGWTKGTAAFQAGEPGPSVHSALPPVAPSSSSL